MLKVIRNKWNQYKYRFVPWLSLNLNKRSVRVVGEKENDKVISDEAVGRFLLNFLNYLESNTSDMAGQLHKQNSKTSTRLKSETANPWSYSKKKTEQDAINQHKINLQNMLDFLGYVIDTKESNLPSGGLGVFVRKGTVPPKSIVAMYPGTVYQPGDPILLPSLGNPFIFQCIDGLHIDGNHRNISGYNYRSCSERDRIGPYECCDTSWLTLFPVNPLAVGQYVNNRSNQFPANVAYQEYDLPTAFPVSLLKYIPNIFFGMNYDRLQMEDYGERVLRTVVLVSLREIQEGEELFSNYFTLVH